MRKLTMTGIIWLSLTSTLWAQIRTWNERDGQIKIEAELLDFDNGDVAAGRRPSVSFP